MPNRLMPGQAAKSAHAGSGCQIGSCRVRLPDQLMPGQAAKSAHAGYIDARMGIDIILGGSAHAAVWPHEPIKLLKYSKKILFRTITNYFCIIKVK
ncbi:MAG: hypothetical protein EA408_08585 [Marinilabiliales bacterium]|nr:MAG: hypothetical protein EA408_08585 [Marinilabiliales bacterium]